MYLETYLLKTNVNELVTLEIVTGTYITGDFSEIDRGADLYFLKIETDPLGTANGTILGTS